jgi:type I restriction-modification system DNA methylase subunit
MVKKSKRAESRCRYYVREEAQRRGWDLRHVSKGGNVLEEQEIQDVFSDIGLGKDRPDFLFCLSSNPFLVVETKNDIAKIDNAINEAIGYADEINATGKYKIHIAVGAAGEEDSGFQIVIRYLHNAKWVSLKSNGFELTNFPTLKEVELALQANDGSTTVTIPSPADFIDAAIELSQVLRTAKVEAPLRPKVIGAVVAAMYQGEISINPIDSLKSVNSLCETAIRVVKNIDDSIKDRLIDALRLSGADFNRLSPYIGRVINILKRLNVRSVIHTDADFLGMFYEAFLRYGYDNNSLGIVFTPRHITRMCADLVGVEVRDKVIDIACGTGGFLVSAFDQMIRKATSSQAKEKVKKSIYGFDTNPTVWALGMLNMFFRGDGKSHILNADCFDESVFENVRGGFSRAFLNPPFSQVDEPERKFIDRAMETLEPDGTLAVVVLAGIFADDEHKSWREQFLKRHKLLAVISLPEDLFYPTAAPTSIMIAQAHTPLSTTDEVFLARVWNDGYEKLKGKRVACEGNQIPEIIENYHRFVSGQPFSSLIAMTIKGADLLDGSEWSPQEWLPQPPVSNQELDTAQEQVARNIFQAVSVMPELPNVFLENFTGAWSGLPNLPIEGEGAITDYFQILNAKSFGERHYSEGEYPYISSGDLNNSIIRLVSGDKNEIFWDGGITVTAFGLACVQPSPFFARGNGGSSVRILYPKYNMSLRELVWFAAQINLQRWRFFYGRMSIKSRLARLKIKAPQKRLPDTGETLRDRAVKFKEQLEKLSQFAK